MSAQNRPGSPAQQGRRRQPRKQPQVEPGVEADGALGNGSIGAAQAQQWRKKLVPSDFPESPAGPSSHRNRAPPAVPGTPRGGRSDGDWRSRLGKPRGSDTGKRLPLPESNVGNSSRSQQNRVPPHAAFDSPQPSLRPDGRSPAVDSSPRSGRWNARSSNVPDLEQRFENLSPFRSTAGLAGSSAPVSRDLDLKYYLELVNQAQDPWASDTKPFESAFKYTVTHADPRTTFRSPTKLREQIARLDNRYLKLVVERSMGLELSEDEYSSDQLLQDPRKVAYRRESLKILLSWVESAPTQQQQRSVLALVRRINQVIQARFPRAAMLVEPFGSVSWGGETSRLSDGEDWDLDLIMRDHARPLGYTEEYWTAGDGPHTQLPSYYNVRVHAQALRQAGFQEVLAIAWANTPIVKFKDARSGCSMDLNLNDLGGYYNSQLILEYCKQSPYLLRPLIHIVKTWSKARKLNDPSGQYGPPSLSSYCWVLICIAFCQDVGIVTNLQHPELLRKSGRNGAAVWVGFGKARGRKVEIEFADADSVDGARLATASERDPENIAHRLAIFFSWLRVFLTPPEEDENDPFGDPREWSGTHGISPIHSPYIDRRRPYRKEALREIELANIERKRRERASHGGNVPTVGTITVSEAELVRQDDAEEPNVQEVADDHDEDELEAEQTEPRMWQSQPLLVQDPFIHGKNCAASLGEKTLKRLRSELDRASRIMDSDNPSIDELLEPVQLPKKLTKKEKRELAEKQRAEGREGNGDQSAAPKDASERSRHSSRRRRPAAAQGN